LGDTTEDALRDCIYPDSIHEAMFYRCEQKCFSTCIGARLHFSGGGRVGTFKLQASWPRGREKGSVLEAEFQHAREYAMVR
jgi:hypothetical protein